MKNMGDCCHMYYTASTCQKFLQLFNVAVGFLAASLTSFLLILSSILEGHPVLGYITVVPYFLHWWWLSSLCSMVYLMVGNSFVPFSWLIPFNNEIPLMLWKLSADHGFCCKMRLRKCQEKLLEQLNFIWV